ncbi:hypothetical protein LSH36_290g04050 [Paralvinella palmiformis]|uniref:Nucleotide exchange factor SIL1 n=1 Tax=Paralvinella palmiformis TaxID=53620 RepID=A0AAD9N1W4_9ANNE|nr:hypothetical protein LSH36_290g04050 [Paralvinella palmiformis]
MAKKEKQYFRSADQLKQDLKELDMTFKTDMELLNELIVKYNNESISTDEKLLVLEEFELLVHQIDNAQYLVDSGGLEFIIRDLNHTDIRISQEAAFVIGSAVQSNPQVQVAAMKAGVMPHLIQKLTLSSDTHIQNRFLYALSTLIRHFPYAQQKMVENGGLHTLTSLVTRSQTAKLKIDLITQLKEQHFCDMIPTLLSLQEHDTCEKILIAMETLFSDCTEAFQLSRDEFRASEEEYSTRAKEEEIEDDSDTYFRDFLGRIRNVLFQIEINGEKFKRTEL